MINCITRCTIFVSTPFRPLILTSPSFVTDVFHDTVHKVRANLPVITSCIMHRYYVTGEADKTYRILQILPPIERYPVWLLYWSWRITPHWFCGWQNHKNLFRWSLNWCLMYYFCVLIEAVRWSLAREKPDVIFSSSDFRWSVLTTNLSVFGATCVRFPGLGAGRM